MHKLLRGIFLATAILTVTSGAASARVVHRWHHRSVHHFIVHRHYRAAMRRNWIHHYQLGPAESPQHYPLIPIPAFRHKPWRQDDMRLHFAARYRHRGGFIHHFVHEALDTPCRVARSLGGPCGCFASELFFGHSRRDLWRAWAWAERFPRAAPGPGTAAVRRHHVVKVIANNGDGTVTVHDSWGIHRQRTAGWVFVRPTG